MAVVKKIFLSALALAPSVVLMSCGPSLRSIKRMQSVEEGVSNPTTIEEYREAIKKYERRAADVVSANGQAGIWWKILGSRYLDKKMYGEALKCYQKAIEYYPQNQNLYYWTGVCAGLMSESALDYGAAADSSQKYNYLKLAESAYLEAIKIEPRYVRAMYGLGVIYVFELDEYDKAVPHLEKLLTIDTGHTDAKFLLANAYYHLARYKDAAAMYDDIAATTKDPDKKSAALANKKQALDADFAR